MRSCVKTFGLYCTLHLWAKQNLFPPFRNPFLAHFLETLGHSWAYIWHSSAAVLLPPSTQSCLSERGQRCFFRRPLYPFPAAEPKLSPAPSLPPSPFSMLCFLAQRLRTSRTHNLHATTFYLSIHLSPLHINRPCPSTLREKTSVRYPKWVEILCYKRNETDFPRVHIVSTFTLLGQGSS